MTAKSHASRGSIIASKERGVPTSSRETRFRSVVLQHLDAAHNLAWWMTRNEDDAADIVQEACLKAWRYLEDHRGNDSKAWLLAIVRSTAIDRLRFKRLYLDVNDDAAFAAPVASPGESEAKKVNEVLTALPHPWREVLVLREVEGLTYQQIGVVLGVPIGTVMSRLSRARDAAHAALTRGTAPETHP